MSKLNTQTRAGILTMLCDGRPMQSIAQAHGVSFGTVSKLLRDAGRACAKLHSSIVRDLNVKRVECSETWSFCYKKRNDSFLEDGRKDRSDVWTWTAIDPQSKLIISWMVGDRDAETACYFIDDLRGRLVAWAQLTMDRDQPDFDVVENVLGTDVDYATLVKIYGAKMLSPSDRPERYYSDFDLVAGNASDRKTENHGDALAIYFVWYNFTKIQNAHKLTPAMAAGVTDRLWTVEDIVALVDSHGPGKRGSQRKRATS